MTAMRRFGVQSEVGKLRKVIVHRPDLSLRRLDTFGTASRTSGRSGTAPF
jgi:arginine deiminase